MELPKAYDAASHEDDIYKKWEGNGYFNPDKLLLRNQEGEPYCIMMPPPNRTGTLHMGHAVMLAVEDLLIRFHRMKGERTLWVPGTDHAAIATQVKVEQLLRDAGMDDPRKELGREKFLERVIAFAEDSAGTIRSQVRKMGSSCDWSREAYTFDEKRSTAVNEMFIRMYDDGLIEKGYRLVNWDPKFKTTLSDDEVEMKEVTARLLTFKYDKDFPITISTTRPETKFGDTAVAVHPNDKRYKKYIGETIEAKFCGKPISLKIVGDEAVDPEYGTGALGVTPAHSFVDAEIAERHGLPTVQVIDENAQLMADTGAEYGGLGIQEARNKIEQFLSNEGLLVSAEDTPQNLPTAQRGGAPVEFLPKVQWFVRVNKPFALRRKTLGKWKKGEKVTLKELMRYSVDSGQINIVPDRFNKIYFYWVDNLRDWCISRQIWFGHQIPAWYRFVEQKTDSEKPEVKVQAENPGKGWVRDTDTLDTWFSSGSWTFSALGWPSKSDDLKTYHPTSVLETGYDILPFWVARMILMSAYALGDVPFKDVYLHGLIRDKEGRKMSKSLGNALDPLDLIPKYGTDAVRLSLLIGTTPGQDMKLSEEKIKDFRNFTNKLWNISRFVMMQMEDESQKTSGEQTLADTWILSRLADITASVTEKLEKYQLSAAGEELREFTWNDFADWYLEVAKIEKGKSEVLREVLTNILKLWHPFMPFVTEHIWEKLGADEMLMIKAWPEFVNASEGDAGDFETLKQIVTSIRRLRADYGIDSKKNINCIIDADIEVEELLGDNLKWVEALTRSNISPKEDVPEGYAMEAIGSTKIGIDIAGAIDVKVESRKIKSEIEILVKYISGTEKKLKNTEFTNKAPEHVVREMSDKLEEAKEKKEALKKRFKLFQGDK